MKHFKRVPPYSRFRTRGVYPATETGGYRLTLSGAPGTANFTSNVVTMGSQHSYAEMKDIVTPGYKYLSSKGNVIFSPMNRHEYVTQGSASGAQVLVTGSNAIPPSPTWDGALYTYSGDLSVSLLDNASVSLRKSANTFLGLYGAVLSGISPAEVQRARLEAITQAAGIPSDASALVALAEGGKTARLLPDLVRSFSNFLRVINTRNANLTSQSGWQAKGRGVASNVKTEIEFLSNLWLASRFGIRPTVHDAIGVVKALQAQLADVKQRITSRGNVQLTRSGSSTGIAGHLGILSTTVTEETSDSITVRANQLWETQVDLADRLGVNIANVPLAITDLTTLSFVVNWMININDYMLALGSLVQPGWKSLGGCVVEKRETATLYRFSETMIKPGTSPQYSLAKGFEGYYQVIERNVTRYPSGFAPTLTVKADPLKWTTDLRVLDAAALFRKQARGAGVLALLAMMQ